jgi:hypothetical protein
VPRISPTVLAKRTASGLYSRGGVDPPADASFEFGHAAVGGAAELAVGELSEPSLHEIHPAGARGSEVQVKAVMAEQPPLHLGVLCVA